MLCTSLTPTRVGVRLLIYMVVVAHDISANVIESHEHPHYTYSMSQNNVNVVYCNYKEITSSYSIITKCNFPHNMPVSYLMFVLKL